MFFLTLHPPKAFSGFRQISAFMRSVRISDQFFPGTEMGNQVVGLWRSFFKFEWTDLPDGGECFWPGWRPLGVFILA